MTFQTLNDVTTALASTLASGSATSAVVTTGDGALFAGASTTDPIRCGFFDATTGALKEIVDVTARSTDTLTIVRAVEDATRFAAGTWTSGTILAAIDSVAVLKQLSSALRGMTIDPAATASTQGLPGGAFHALYHRVITPGSWSISSIGMVVTTSSGNIMVGVYRDNGSDAPGTLVQASSSVACPAAGSASVSLGATITLRNGDWIALNADNTTAKFMAALQGASANYPTWRSVTNNAGSLTLVSNPASLSADLRMLALWGI